MSRRRLHCDLIFVPVASSSPSLSSSLSPSPAPTSLRAVVPVATARRAGHGRRLRATLLASAIVAAALAFALRRCCCFRHRHPRVPLPMTTARRPGRPTCGDSKAGGAGAVAVRDAAGHNNIFYFVESPSKPIRVLQLLIGTRTFVRHSIMWVKVLLMQCSGIRLRSADMTRVLASPLGPTTAGSGRPYC